MRRHEYASTAATERDGTTYGGGGDDVDNDASLHFTTISGRRLDYDDRQRVGKTVGIGRYTPGRIPPRRRRRRRRGIDAAAAAFHCDS